MMQTFRDRNNNVLQNSHFKKGDSIRVKVTPADGKGWANCFFRLK